LRNGAAVTLLVERDGHKQAIVFLPHLARTFDRQSSDSARVDHHLRGLTDRPADPIVTWFFDMGAYRIRRGC